MDNTSYKNYFWILLDVLVAGMIVNLVFFVMPAIKQFGDSFMPSRYIMVSAEGKTIVSPDVAEASFSVVSQGKNPEQLSSENNGKMSVVVENLASHGVDKKDVKTTSYNLSPSYGYDKNTGRSYIYSYTLTQTILVKVRDLQKVSEIIGGLTPLGINQIGGVSFTVDEPEKFLAEARADALKNARAKADAMASESGAKLGKILNVAEFQNQPPTPYFKERALGVAMAPSMPAPAIEPGTQEIKVQVSLTYALE